MPLRKAWSPTDKQGFKLQKILPFAQEAEPGHLQTASLPQHLLRKGGVYPFTLAKILSDKLQPRHTCLLHSSGGQDSPLCLSQQLSHTTLPTPEGGGGQPNVTSPAPQAEQRKQQ